MGVSFGEKIKSARKSKGFTQKQLAAKINAAHNSISDWENDKNKPDPDTIELLCGVLEITPNYLLAASPDDFSPKDKLLVRRYNDLDFIGQSHVDAVLQWETERVQQLEQATAAPAATRMINYYYRLASAGTGQIIFDMPPTKRIEIPAIPEYRKADYAIGVNGNSMEPVYHDGDTLLVEMIDNVEIGEIGIFLVNGESFVKERGETELISLNPDSKNVPLNEDARCLGRVIGKL